MMPELLGLPYSPWSEKARWALDARRVPYREVTYAPLLGEPALRLKLKRWRGNVTVPVLTDDEGRHIALVSADQHSPKCRASLEVDPPEFRDLCRAENPDMAAIEAAPALQQLLLVQLFAAYVPVSDGIIRGERHPLNPD